MPELEQIRRYCGPYRACKAVSSLRGLLHGISSDHQYDAAEHSMVAAWHHEYADLWARRPFNELADAVADTLSDGKLTRDEVEDLLWLCDSLDLSGDYFCPIRDGLQELQGIIAGIAADKVITPEELDNLSYWLEDHPELRVNWPFTEVEAMLTAIRADSTIDAGEHALMLEFFSQFMLDRTRRSRAGGFGPITLKGVCAVQPEVIFSGKTFCFTGASARVSRSELEKLVCEKGGAFWPRVTKGVDYLIVGSNGNPCWAFACYGRKVEQAMKLRHEGQAILIVHEVDFWDAMN